MKERPILFNGEMVRAVLDGTKTQTRRVMRVQPPNRILSWQDATDGEWFGHDVAEDVDSDSAEFWPSYEKGIKCPYGVAGDRLWVRETFNPTACDGGLGYRFRADDPNGNCPECGEPCRWKPSIFMPRDASRITLEVLSVRAERVTVITPQEAIAEGVTGWAIRENERRTYNIKTRKRRPKPLGPNVLDGTKRGVPYHVNAFAELWDSINAKRGFGWDVNPWIWAVEFKDLSGARV